MGGVHWHAFSYDGASVPSDVAGRDPQQPAAPNELRLWFTKPASTRKGTFTDPDSAHAWMETELEETYGHSEELPDLLAFYRTHLDLGQDACAGFYAAGGYHVRDLLTCPRTGADPRPVRCPDPPRGS